MSIAIAMSTAAFFLFLALPVWAQHGGGHGGGGGGHAGFSGGGHAGGGFSGGHSSFGGSHAFSGGSSFGAHAFSGSRSNYGAYSGARPGMNSSRGYARSFSRPAARAPYLHSEIGLGNSARSANNRFANNRFGTRNGWNFRISTYGFRNGFYNCSGWRCWGSYGLPWWGYDPWWWGSDSSYDDDYYQNLGIANQMNEESLEEQQMLRQQEADQNQGNYDQRYNDQRNNDQDARNQDEYVRPPMRPRSSQTESSVNAPLPATLLVFRDQHKEEVHNYAIIGPTLWNFSPQHTEKISLADLDLAATTKANEDRGVTFRIPVPNGSPAPTPNNMQGQPPAPAGNRSTT